MRIRTYASALFVAASVHATGMDWSSLPPIEDWRAPWTKDPDVEVALEVRCAADVRDRDPECAQDLSQRFASGELEPQAVIRLHCTRWQSPWEPSQSPPQLCRERFGGWIRG